MKLRTFTILGVAGLTALSAAAGLVGCFTPVIAIIDESFFTTDDTMTEEVDAAE
jgi:hypothetical protein